MSKALRHPSLKRAALASVLATGLAALAAGAFALASSNATALGNLDVLGGNLNGPASPATTPTIGVSGNIAWTGRSITWNSGNPVAITQTGSGSLSISCPSATQPILNSSSITTTDPTSISCANFVTVAGGHTPSLTTTSMLSPGNGVALGPGSGSGTFTAAGMTLQPGGSNTFGIGPNSLVLTGGNSPVPSGDTFHSGPVTLQGGMLQVDGTVSPATRTTGSRCC